MIKKEKGITLIALVVTIIVLLILAGVTLYMALGDSGIIDQAQSAKQQTEARDEREQVELAVVSARNTSLNGRDFYEALKANILKEFNSDNVTQGTKDNQYIITLNNGNVYYVEGEELVTPLQLVEIATENPEEPEQPEEPDPPETGNLEEVDTVKIPEGFHHVDGDKREEGIVVADESGNFEYVWIPVTKDENGNPTQPYIATNGKLNGKEIQLQRTGASSYKEETTEEHATSGKQNAIAENITAFKDSVIKNGGYFLGRYEAGIVGGTLAENPSITAPDKNYTYWMGGTLVCKAGQQVWNWVTQNRASELCKNIDNSYTGVTSDLINSYAWNTAIVFIQACGIESNSSNYANQVGKSTTPSVLSKTGEALLADIKRVDKQCNIYDMAGNCWEWSTETSNSAISPSVSRGGYYGNGTYNTSYRSLNTTTYTTEYISFRPLLYWNT